MLGISKRGDAYLRQLLVHGARAAVHAAKRKDDRLSRWIQGLLAHKHSNVVTVALANKNGPDGLGVDPPRPRLRPGIGDESQ